MIFLIQYDRAAGKIVSFTRFTEAQRDKAATARLALEIQLNERKIGHEIVLLDAANEEALHKTHRRYFENLETLARIA